MPKWVEAARLADIAANACKPVEVDDVSVVLVRLGDEVRALHNVCSHMDYPLHAGPVDGETIQCPLHGARFDLRTGAVRAMPAARPIKAFATRVENGIVFLDAEELADL